jgi:hypothetical protein
MLSKEAGFAWTVIPPSGASTENEKILKPSGSWKVCHHIIIIIIFFAEL